MLVMRMKPLWLLIFLAWPALAHARSDAGPPQGPDAGIRPSWEEPEPDAGTTRKDAGPPPAPDSKPQPQQQPQQQPKPQPQQQPKPLPPQQPKPQPPQQQQAEDTQDPAVMELDKMTVVGTERNAKITNTEISVEKFEIEELAEVPTFMGEKDIMKTLQLTPGITSITEGRANFIVRGSGIDQNLVLMDGMPLYYTSHMLGLYSVFNSDAVSSLSIHKGGTPARHGTRAASVLDVKMIGDEVDRLKAKLSIGLITSKLAVQVPVPYLEDKLWISLAARTSYLSIGMLHDVINDDCVETEVAGKGGSGCTRTSGGSYGAASGGDNDQFFFFGRPEWWYDVNAKVVFKPSQDHKLTLSGFFSEDRAELVGSTWWGNRAGSLRWDAQWTDALLSRTTGYVSQYWTQNLLGIFDFRQGITTGGFRHDFTWFPYKEMQFVTGFDLEYQDFNHGTVVDAYGNFGKFMPPMQSLETALHAGVTWENIFPGFTAYAGLRWSLFFRLGPGNQQTFDETTNEEIQQLTVPHGAGEVMSTHHNPEPRVNLTYAVNDANSLKFSYNRSAQYVRLMTNSMQLQWFDIWFPSTQNVSPIATDQWALGYFFNVLGGTEWQIDGSVEGYYKDMNNVPDFEDGLFNVFIDNLEAYVATGDGRAYGLELMIKKQKGWVTGWVSYNLGRSEQQIDGINRDEWYPSKFDKTHDFTFLLSVEPLSQFVPGHKLYFTLLFLYQTGNAITLPEGYYYVEGSPFPYWEGRNRYRAPDYHRLDLGLKYEVDVWRTLKTTVELNFYNVYDRRNVNTITYNMAGGKGTGKGGTSNSDPNTPLFVPTGVSYYGFRPSATLTIEY